MTEARILHEKAMDFLDEAQLAKMEGSEKASSNFFRKAYNLEKEAVSVAEENHYNKTTIAVYKRSAAALALKSGLYYEAVMMINSAMQDNPPKFILKELDHLNDELKEKAPQFDINNLLQIQGKVQFINLAENEIIVKDSKRVYSYNILVPENILEEILKKYKRTEVTIEATPSPSGVFILKNIKKAA